MIRASFSTNNRNNNNNNVSPKNWRNDYIARILKFASQISKIRDTSNVPLKAQLPVTGYGTMHEFGGTKDTHGTAMCIASPAGKILFGKVQYKPRPNGIVGNIRVWEQCLVAIATHNEDECTFSIWRIKDLTLSEDHNPGSFGTANCELVEVHKGRSSSEQIKRAMGNPLIRELKSKLFSLNNTSPVYIEQFVATQINLNKQLIKLLPNDNQQVSLYLASKEFTLESFYKSMVNRASFLQGVYPFVYLVTKSHYAVLDKDSLEDNYFINRVATLEEIQAPESNNVSICTEFHFGTNTHFMSSKDFTYLEDEVYAFIDDVNGINTPEFDYFKGLEFCSENYLNRVFDLKNMGDLQNRLGRGKVVRSASMFTASLNNKPQESFKNKELVTSNTNTPDVINETESEENSLTASKEVIITMTGEMLDVVNTIVASNLDAEKQNTTEETFVPREVEINEDEYVLEEVETGEKTPLNI